MPLALLTKLDLKTILALLCVGLSIALCFMLYQNNGLKAELIVVNVALQTEKHNSATLDVALQKQNEAIKRLKVTKTKADTTRLEAITLSNDTCEAQLQGYKEIFRELGRDDDHTK